MAEEGVGRVLVAGGGIGGLTLAHALVGAGIDVRVHEADDGSGDRAQGFRIGLGAPAMEVLRSVLPARLHRLLEVTSGSLTGPGLVFDDQLNLLSSDLQGPPEDSRAMDRQVLRRVLLGGLGDRVTQGHRLLEMTEAEDGVTARFTGGGEASGAILVGADGGNSVVRRRLLPEMRLVDSDLCGAMGRTPMTERFSRLVPGRGTMVRGPRMTLMLGRMQFDREPSEAAAELAPELEMPRRESYVRWVLMVPPDHPAAAGPSRTDARELVLELIEGWHPDLRDLIAASDLSGAGGSRVLDRPLPPFPVGRVTLLGDAAHLTLASGGNGANTAIRDASRLCQGLVEIDRGRDRRSALGEYQRDLLARGNAAVEHSLAALRRFVPAGTAETDR